MDINWDELWAEMRSRFMLGDRSIHGPVHWRRVERYGVHVASRSGGDVLVVRLFAVFHDVCRVSDHQDDAHGARAAMLVTALRGRFFDLPDDACEKLHYACTWHTLAHLHDDPTIGACWDADRLDIWRVGCTPNASFMSTPCAREMVQAGRIGPEYVSEEE